MMQLLRVEIEGFRGIQEAEIWLETHCVLLGPNGVGKSSLVDAVAFLLGRDRLSGPLSDYDFHGAFPEAQSRIRIRGLFGRFNPNRVAAQPIWFNARGAVPMWLDEASRDVAADQDKKHDQLCMEVGYCARFNPEILEYESLRHFVDSVVDPFVDEDVHRLSAAQLSEIGFFLLPSSRTWDKTLSFASELFRRTLATQNGLPASELLDLRDRLLSMAGDLESDEGFSELMTRIRADLAGFVGSGTADLRLQMTAGDVRSVLDAIVMGVSTSSGFRIPVGRAGSGVRAFQALLLLLELGRTRMAGGKAFLLAAEEPELHLNPSLHRRLVGRIRASSSQSMVTTHSPEIAAHYRPLEILFLRAEAHVLTATPLLSASASMPEANALMRLLTIHRSELCEALMNRYVLIPEGETEYRWFRALLRALNAAEAAETPEGLNGLGVIPTQSSSVVAAFLQFSMVNAHCIPIVDGDPAGDSYVRGLAALESPPAVVIQLGEQQELEHLLAWIILGDSECDLEGVGLPAEMDWFSMGVDVLADTLGSCDFKTRWDIHEELAWEIATKAGARSRAISFLSDLMLAIAGDRPSSGRWETDAATSTSAMTVWRLRLADCRDD